MTQIHTQKRERHQGKEDEMRKMWSICSRSCQNADIVLYNPPWKWISFEYAQRIRRAGDYTASHLWLDIELQATVEINRKTNFKLREPEETRAHVGAKHGTPYHSGVGLVLEAPSMSSCNSNELTNNIAISPCTSQQVSPCFHPSECHPSRAWLVSFSSYMRSST